MMKFRKDIPESLVIIRDPVFTLAESFLWNWHKVDTFPSWYGIRFGREQYNHDSASHVRTMHSLWHRHPRRP